MQDSEGNNWWNSGRVSEEIIKEVKNRIKAEEDGGLTSRSDSPIDYTTFGELIQIINKSWDIFATIFNSQRAVQRVLTNLNGLRGPIAHCCPLAEDEIDRLNLTVKDLFRMIG